MQIGLLANRAGVPVDTVRYYERVGLLPRPTRQPSGYRRYEDEDVLRLRFIRKGKHLGFSLDEIRDLLALSSGRDADMAGAKAAAVARLQAIDARIDELMRVRSALRAVADRCPGHGSRTACPILAALGGD